MEFEINQRIQKIIDRLGVSAYEFSKRIGNKRPDGIYKILNNEVSPSPKTLNKIKTNIPDLNYSWLLTGEGYMFNKEIEYKSIGIYPGNDYDALKREVAHLEQINSQLSESNENLKKMISILEDRIDNLKNQNSNFQKNH